MTADFVVVANRLPVNKQTAADGTVTWTRAPGGLVTALAPVFDSQPGAWVGWTGSTDADDRPHVDGIDIHAVPLSAAEVEDYYEGFSNSTLWPLYHDVLVKPEYRADWWDVYVEVNRRFAAAAAAAASPGATVWVQDYQLQLVPAMLRQDRPDLKIGFFLHIPFPPYELFSQLPWRREILEGLLGADLIGFHLPGGAQNFLTLARRILGADASTGPVGVRTDFGTVALSDRTVRVGSFPISIDSASVAAQSSTDAVAQRAAAIREELGDPKTLLLGVDRLDYTKGIDVRVQALQRLFADGRLDPADTVFVQLASPSRENVESYARLRDLVERTVAHINGTYGTAAAPPIRYLLQPVPRDELLAYFVAADATLVTPLRDGMNLVTKEYIACRDDLGGALVLSEFTGAAMELSDAYLMNPYDPVSTDAAIVAAVTDDDAERRRRMTLLRDQVMNNDVDQWARSFLQTLKS
ncbi:alpha,alpha-trehalose-phosphate synthase [Gordonia hirsuta DSM 44140 = NBRC 16056]|uniref:alpha,alpha-trehalose-phosphate synthase (ADP-forming) n=1 Tax=Gordonia hirsuta DSM 44140 = NBRC 16056 TaxID=1121927 RepID=L7L847_9ACTN|nr:trehalose-6-phosphate synthase [Gordonia hirsuta]GAC56921.1 alpha,alpha-trehalose-phosphate synthase [Gordonia hirsuta DSM 44140 = NBRC 16056]